MRSIELFAGIGGIALAAEWAGIETVAFCEREPYAQKILNKHWPDVPIFDDVRTLNKQALKERGIDVGAIELISGGFPCQPFSIAGKRKGKEDDRDLWPEMFRIIEELRPRWVVGENVANFVNMELDRTLSDLESIGYIGKSFVIPACAVDAKHRRDRTFVVAYSGHTEPPRWIQAQKGQQSCGWRETRSEPSSCGLHVPDTSCERCNQVEQHDSGGMERERAIREDRKRSVQPRGDTSWWQVEPGVGRVADGIPNRVDRLRGLGNAVVPQQIYPIFKYIMEIERGNQA